MMYVKMLTAYGIFSLKRQYTIAVSFALLLRNLFNLIVSTFNMIVNNKNHIRNKSQPDHQKYF